jgi:NAD(P)-dependent dehydrogenase (short-subunit alcohol dehydrogenase family)
MKSGIELFNLTNRVALVTGGTKGLGRSMAEGLASAGAQLVIASRHHHEATTVATEIAEKFNTKAIGIRADVRDPESVEWLVHATTENLGGPDILIKC